MRELAAFARNRGLVTLTLGHFTVDSYVGLLPVLFPLLIGRFHLTLATVGLVALAYTGLASVSQPLFGVIADRRGTRFTGVALAWTAVTFALVGFAPTFPALVAIAALSGLGSGFFHPLGALAVRALLPRRGANTAMSVYVTGGTLGVAAGPIIGVLVFGLLGPRGTAVMIVPGLLFGGYLLLAMRERRDEVAGRGAAGPAARVALVPLVATILVMASRSWTTTTLQAFTPTWYERLGYQPWFYGPLATTVVLASALGTVGTGSLADRFGRRAVIVGSLVATIPALVLFVAFPGPLGFLWAALVGATAASTAPLTLLLGQELMSGQAGFASGLIMGLGFVTGAIGVPVTGFFADHLGLQAALALQLAVVAVTIPVALLLPGEGFMAALRGRAEPEVEAAPGTAPAAAGGG